MMRWLYRLADLARHKARLRLWTPEQAIGRRGEDLAHRFLERMGYRVVARNYRAPGRAGEIDLIAWDGETLVMVEVKTLTTTEYSSPERAIDPHKLRSLFDTAASYRRRAGLGWDRVRFDTVSVLLSIPVEITLRRDAFHPHQDTWRTRHGSAKA